MKTEHLTYFSYDHHNSMVQSGQRFTVNLTDDGRVHVVIDERSPFEQDFYLDDTALLDELQSIIKTYKMDKYKERYESPIEIFDGDSWSLYYRYDSKRSVSSGGYMEWPENYREMRQALSALFSRFTPSDSQQ